MSDVRTVVTLGTATPGGGFPVYGQAVADTVMVPANSYPGQTADLVSVGSWSFILARPTLPDEVAYRVTRALHRGEPALGARLPQARETTAANTVLAAPSPDRLHPGTCRYLAELGLLRSP